MVHLKISKVKSTGDHTHIDSNGSLQFAQEEYPHVEEFHYIKLYINLYSCVYYSNRSAMSTACTTLLLVGEGWAQAKPTWAKLGRAWA